jgi:hypothetical protein
MTPVFQDKFAHNWKWGGGNCLQAATASFFDLPLEAVPHFMLFGDKQWWPAFQLFIKCIGHECLGWVDGEPPKDGKYYIVSTSVNTDFNHAVIYKDGQIIHDPHPVKGSLGQIEGYYAIIKK